MLNLPKLLSLVTPLSIVVILLLFFFQSPLEQRIKANVRNKKDDYSLIIKKIKRTISESNHGILIHKKQLDN
jgi:hypothetical protein